MSHPDDLAVDRFAEAMKIKLKHAREQKGRGGWEDKEACSQADLSRMLLGHIGKGDPVDVANFCMMLHQRGEGIVLPGTETPEPYPWRGIMGERTIEVSKPLCSRCQGTGSYLEQGDLHRSEGWVPCGCGAGR